MNGTPSPEYENTATKLRIISIILFRHSSERSYVSNFLSYVSNVLIHLQNKKPLNITELVLLTVCR